MSDAEALKIIRDFVDAQAEDESIWFKAQTITEAHLQQELRQLHACIERNQEVIENGECD
jgi:hypothetical protein